MFTRVAAYVVAALFLTAPGPSHRVSLAVADTDAAAMTSSPAFRNDAVPALLEQARDALAALSHQAPLDPQDAPIRRSAPLPLEPFSSSTMPWFSGDVFERWQDIEKQIRSDNDVLARCREAMTECPAAAKKFVAIVDGGRARTGRARIGAINRAVNLAIQPMSDLKQWGVVEHWSAPLETFTTGHGDCEDYAIAKFVALIAAGVAPQDVKLVIVHDKISAEGHAVTAVRVDGHWLVLDNRWLTLAEDRDLTRMAPLFVMDHTGVRTYVRSLPGAVASAS
jgi:predicted transglutaminase-like cysteine proteinase